MRMTSEQQTWTVRDVMSEDVITASRDTPYKVLVEQLLLSGVSGLPVLDSDARVTGVVSESDLLVKEEQGGGSAVMRWIRHLSAVAAEGGSAALERTLAELDKAVGRTAADVMTSPAIVVGPEASLEKAARLMHRHDLKRLPVVDQDGRLVGIVSRGDLLKVFMRTDGALERAARDVLRTVLSEPDEVAVSVVEGVVTVSGEVEAGPEAEAIIGRIEALPGVVGVEDHLRAAL